MDKWTFLKKAKFILTYAYYKLWLIYEVKSPKLRFLAFELRYSLVNLINTIRAGSFAQVFYHGPELLKTSSGTFRVRSGSQDAAIASPAFERQDFEFLAQVLRDYFSSGESAGLLDIGANIGVYTIQTALRTKPDFKIWAFEPIGENRIVLNENLRLNSIAQERVTVLPIALGKVNDEVTMHFSKAFPGHASTEASAGSETQTFKVERRRADDLLQNLPRRLLVKIDVEGHEVEVLEGMAKILASSDLVWLCIEDVVHREQIYQALARIGFEFKAKSTPYNSWWAIERS